jgi:hypothetical protein
MSMWYLGEPVLLQILFSHHTTANLYMLFLHTRRNPNVSHP